MVLFSLFNIRLTINVVCSKGYVALRLRFGFLWKQSKHNQRLQEKANGAPKVYGPDWWFEKFFFSYHLHCLGSIRRDC